MSLDTHVFGDPASCYACADSLATLSTGVKDQLKSARDGRTESEYEFKGTAGDEFRLTLDRIIAGTTEAADEIDVVAAAMRVFADELVTARARMSQAETTASEAGIPVEFGTGIGDPLEVDPNSYDVAPQVLRAKQVLAYDTAAGLGDPYPEATAARAVRVFRGGADDAARFAAENSRLLAGLGDNKFVQLLGSTADDYLPKGSALSQIGSKVPFVGAALTGLQTVSDVMNAETTGDAVKAAAKDVGGFIAGTVATELILASAAGGPVTLLAVGAGVGVAFGVGEAIEHWDDISGAAGSAAHWVGNLF